MNKHVNINRRSFVIGTAAAGAGLAIGLDLPMGGPTVVRAADGSPEVNVWVVIRPDDTTVIRIARSEMGQGTLTGLAQLVADWERAAHAAPVPTACLRTGQVLTPEGGFLGKQRLPFTLGLGGRIGSGRQFLSWIHIDDYTRLVEHLLTAKITGPVNLTAPKPVTNTTFTNEYARSLNRPALIPLPLPALRLMFGSEMVDEALLSGSRVLPRRALDDGFTFDHPELAQALSALG